MSDSLALEFMRPRTLNFAVVPSKSKTTTPRPPPSLNTKHLIASEATLQKLDIHLRDFSYVHGFEFSTLDLQFATYIEESSLSASLVNVRRWLNHIHSIKEQAPKILVTKSVETQVLSQFGNNMIGF